MAQVLGNNQSTLTFCYWAIRGLAQPIRFMLAEANIQVNEIRLGVDQNGRTHNEDEEDEDWSSHRATLHLPFPNLPYLIDSSGTQPIQITQSNAILRYIARNYGFYGENENDRIQIDILQEEAYDYRNKIVKAAYTLGDAYSDAFADFSNNAVPRHVDGFERFLSARSDTTHFVGENLSLVDFVIYELMWQTRLMLPDSISESSRPHINTFISQFSSRPRIAAYIQSKDYIERPINSPWASFA